ncbi:MAG TPA: DinB family protein [Candidatus Limnocylindria bacterium]|nr:DinB family protein [Candidatus Limnocylindria bacterium]
MSQKPPATEAWRSSITARVTAMNDMLDLAIADLTTDQVNRVERKGVLPIAFSLAHVVGSQDRSASRFLADGAPSLWESAAWAERVRLAGALPFRGTPMEEAERIRIGDMDAWREYQSAVFAKTESALENAPLALFDRDAFGGGRPDLGTSSFLGLLVPSGPITVADVCEAFLFQHAARHLGEIEHARALLGLGGLS